MESFFSRFKNTLVLIALLLAQTIGLATQIRRPADPSRPDGHHVRLVRLWALGMISPFERVISFSGHGLRDTWSSYIDLRHVHQQNKDLEKEVAQLRLEKAALAEDALEAQRLRAIMAFKQQYVSSTVLTRVIGTSGVDASRMLILDKGAQDGLRPDMAVITPDGVVGKLRDVFPGTSQLLLLNDSTSGAGVFLETTRVRAIVRGTPQGRLVIASLLPDARIKPGERVLSSGGDQVYPRGLPVGTIESVGVDPEHPPYALIVLKPAANLNRLEEVLVITATSPTLDPKAQQQLASDAATSVEARAQARAAEISAERLPSLHDDKARASEGVDPNAAAAAEAAPPSDKSTSLVPKPKPAVRPDRYSPGAAPPASALTPGSPRPATPQRPAAANETTPRATRPPKPDPNQPSEAQPKEPQP